MPAPEKVEEEEEAVTSTAVASTYQTPLILDAAVQYQIVTSYHRRYRFGEIPVTSFCVGNHDSTDRIPNLRNTTAKPYRLPPPHRRPPQILLVIL